MLSVKRIARVGTVLLIAIGVGQLVETLRRGDAVVIADSSAGNLLLNNPSDTPKVAASE
jgi:hypothetical protein